MLIVRGEFKWRFVHKFNFSRVSNAKDTKTKTHQAKTAQESALRFGAVDSLRISISISTFTDRILEPFSAERRIYRVVFVKVLSKRFS